MFGLIHGAIPEFFMTTLNNGSPCEGVTQWQPSLCFVPKDLNINYTNVSFTVTKHECNLSIAFCNLLKPTGHVMHQQFNIQQLYALPTLYLCVLYLSENKQRLVPLTA